MISDATRVALTVVSRRAAHSAAVPATTAITTDRTTTALLYRTVSGIFIAAMPM